MSRQTHHHPDAAELLIEAGSVLSSSLDMATTLRQVAELAVPALADLCVIDICDEDGSIRDVAVVADDPALAAELTLMRRRFPLSSDGAHPVASVLRTGESMLIEDLTPPLLTRFAQGSEHQRFMIEHGYRSALVVPLRARSRTLGAISALRLGDSASYVALDLSLLEELARRAALAIDNARLYGELHRVEQRLEAVLRNLAEAITVVDRSGRTIFANAAAAELLGAESAGEITDAEAGSWMPRFAVSDEHGRELSLEDMPGRRIFQGEQDVEPLLVRNVVRATGEERWLIVRSSPVTDPDSDEVSFAVNVFENITAVKRAQLEESFMAEASRILASSMDYEETLHRVAQLAVPTLADWCVVDVLNERGMIERVAAHHSDPAMRLLADELGRSYQPSADDDLGVPDVIRTGEVRVYNDIDPQALAGYARDREHLRLLTEVNARSVAIVPLAGPTRTLGAITLVSSESGRRVHERDVDLAVRLGRRSGAAVENARLYTERKRIADVLARALLPSALPNINGIELAARYHPTGELNDVGGDFYDVLPYGQGWLLIMGDVCGSGAMAASATALARHTLRAAAMNRASLTQMLGMLHSAMADQRPGADVCTVSLVAVTERSPESCDLQVALAGHPPPLLLSLSSGARQIGSPGTLLGAIDPIEIVEEHVTMTAGETLLLYTDGLSEAGRLSDEQLLAMGNRIAGAPLESLLDQVEATAREHGQGQLDDDLALLAMRLG